MQVLQPAADVAVRSCKLRGTAPSAWADVLYLSSENGVGELYAYVPHSDTNTQQLLAVPPRSIQHPDYGFSVGRGAWTFASGRWTRITERVKINDVGQENGACPLSLCPWPAHAGRQRKARSRFSSTENRSSSLQASSCELSKVPMHACKVCISKLSLEVGICYSL